MVKLKKQQSPEPNVGSGLLVARWAWRNIR
jgi:hypothetical protein